MPTTNKFIELWRYIHVLSVAFLLSGCDARPTTSDQVVIYQSRLANVLDAQAPDNHYDSLLQRPESQLHKPDLQEPQLGLLEFQRLQACSIATLIAQRNTSLGKTMLPSQLLVYERTLLKGLEECIPLVNQASTKQKIGSVLNYKTQMQGFYWRRFWTQSAALNRALFSNQSWLHQVSAKELQQTQAALDYLLGLQAPLTVPESAELESHLQALERSQLLAKAFRTQQAMAHGLRDTTALLVQNTSESTCSAKNGKAFDYLNNVFQRFFIQQIQGTAAELAKVQRQAYPLLAQLISDPDFPVAMRTGLAFHLEAGKEDYDRALQEHVKFWQSLFARCRRKPGRS